MNIGPVAFVEFQGQWFRTKRELFTSKNARKGRFPHLLLQAMAGSTSLWPAICCLWGAEPLNSKDPDRLIDKLIAYILQVRRQPTRHFYSHSDIITMEKTAVWQDMLSSTTVDNVGEKSVRLKTTGYEQSKVSVCLTTKADETKLKSFIVFRGPREKQSSLTPWTPELFCQNGVSWTFWCFLGSISVKLPLIRSKMPLHHNSLASSPLASQCATFCLGHAQKSKF